jgi:hypothetical protein
MTEKHLPSSNELRQLLRYEPGTGKVYWLRRTGQGQPIAAFNAKYAGREAFTSLRANGYLAGGIGSSKFLAHRIVWALHYGVWPQGEIDHINGNRADNRITNLRDVPHRANSQNMKRFANNSSGVTGVVWSKQRGSWIARIKVDYKLRHLGVFNDYNDAVNARREAEARFGFHANHGRD